MLAFSRKQVMTPKIIDLNELVAGSIKMLESLIKENIALRSSDSRKAMVKIDPTQMELILIWIYRKPAFGTDGAPASCEGIIHLRRPYPLSIEEQEF